MTVTQVLMGCGSFSGRLKANAKQSTINALDYFDTISILPNRLLPLSGFDDATILANAVYTGVLTDTKPDGRTLRGWDAVPFFLESPKFRGDLITSPLAPGVQSLSDWIADLCPASVDVGTVNNSGTISEALEFYLTGRRRAIDQICDTLGAEWRGNPDFTLDAATIANLYPTATTPEVMLTPFEDGTEGAIRGIQGTMLAGGDVDDYATQVHVAQPGEGTAIDLSSSSVSSHYKDPFGNDLVMEELIDGGGRWVNWNRALTERNQVRRHLEVSSQTYVLPAFARPGDYVWAFDQRAGLVDAANQIVWRGEVTTPVKLRIYKTTWPIPEGAQVAARSMATGSAVWTDLSDDFEFESGDTAWEVGTTPLPPP